MLELSLYTYHSRSCRWTRKPTVWPTFQEVFPFFSQCWLVEAGTAIKTPWSVMDNDGNIQVAFLKQNSLYCTARQLWIVHTLYNRGYFVQTMNRSFPSLSITDHDAWITVPSSTNQHWEKNGNTSWKVDHTVGCPVQRELCRSSELSSSEISRYSIIAVSHPLDGSDETWK